MSFPALEHRGVRHVNGRAHRFLPVENHGCRQWTGSANRRQERKLGMAGCDTVSASAPLRHLVHRATPAIHRRPRYRPLGSQLPHRKGTHETRCRFKLLWVILSNVIRT
jgi:hypothetical protein